MPRCPTRSQPPAARASRSPAGSRASSTTRHALLRSCTAALLVVAVLAGSGAARAEERKLPPVDEAAGDVSWLRFKKQLIGAIERRDKQFLLSILDKNVRNQDERTRGVAHFRKQWELDTADSPLWEELAKALQLGGAFIKREKRPREFCAPYLLGRWPADVEPVRHAAIISRDAPVQSEPSTAAPSLGRLSYDIVPVIDWEVDDKAPDARQKWVKIRYRNRDAFVPEEQVRSPIEQAACFAKGPNGWRMTGFAPAGGE